MLVVDASCLFDIVTRTPRSTAVERRLTADPDQVAPHIVDVEVFGVIRRERLRGALDETEARQAIEDLAQWPGERFPHRPLLDRAWALRENVRGWDAMYVALAEVLEAVLLTTDRRLAAASGPRCRIEVVE